MYCNQRLTRLDQGITTLALLNNPVDTGSRVLRLLNYARLNSNTLQSVICKQGLCNEATGITTVILSPVTSSIIVYIRVHTSTAQCNVSNTSFVAI